MAQNHIIQRQTMRTHVIGSPEQAVEVQQLMADLMQSPRYLKALDGVLNEFGKAGQWLSLDKIELNIGQLKADDLEKQFISKLTDALREQLHDAIPDAVLQGKTVSKTEQQFDFEAFIEFLEDGVFKTYLPHKLGKEMDFEAWAIVLIEQLTDKQIAVLTALFQQSQIARRRLFYQFSQKVVVLVFSKMNREGPLPIVSGSAISISGSAVSILTLEKLKSLSISTGTAFFETVIDFIFLKIINNQVVELKVFDGFLQTISSLKLSKAGQRQAVLDFIQKGHYGKHLGKDILAALESIGHDLMDSLMLERLKLLSLDTDKTFLETVIDFILFYIKNKRLTELKQFEDLLKRVSGLKLSREEERQEILSFIKNAPPQYRNGFDAKNRERQEEASPQYLEQKKNQEATESKENAVIYIQNAGIVLLHPFLKFCFDACGWLKDEGFKNEKTQQRALLMLHFLATGQFEAAEFDLFLPKILCNAPENIVILRGGRLTKKEKAEGESMLKAAIAHWQVLKNTSPDGLREAFLQRDGKLERNPFGGWTLTVGQKAQDVLLGQLPYGWGVSLVKLDWMPAILQVNWA
jgi:Contractile injection system tape measure protein